MKKEKNAQRAQRVIYKCPLVEIIEVETHRPFAVSHVTTVDSQISVDEWGSSDNEVSFD